MAPLSARCRRCCRQCFRRCFQEARRSSAAAGGEDGATGGLQLREQRDSQLILEEVAHDGVQLQEQRNDPSEEEQFYSFIDDAQVIEDLAAKRSVRRTSIRNLVATRVKMPPSNANRPSHFQWFKELLSKIVEGNAGAAAGDAPPFRSGAPLFVVAGACPNVMCGMQAVLYCKLKNGAVDFWWIKPEKRNGQKLDHNTLELHTSGPFKNAAGKARAVYEPLAEKFSGGVDGEFTFGIDDAGRAFAEERLEEPEPGERRRMLIYFVWQEAWSGAMARKKFLQGKFCYQRSADLAKGVTAKFYARQYRIQDGRLRIAVGPEEEELLPDMFPPDSFQEMHEMSAS